MYHLKLPDIDFGILIRKVGYNARRLRLQPEPSDDFCIVHKGLDDAKPLKCAKQFLNKRFCNAIWVKRQYTPLKEIVVMTKRYTPAPPGYRYVFRPWRTCPKTGDKLYAKAFGIRAWPILIPE